MTASLRCSSALHEALKLDVASFARAAFLSYQVVEGDNGPVDIQELRDCPHCGRTIGRTLGIAARLAAARAAFGGNGDQDMIGRCKRALLPDPLTMRIDDSAIRSFLDALEIERLMARTGGRS